VFTYITDTDGVPGSCPLQDIPSGYKYLSRCKATKDYCIIAKEGRGGKEVDALVCPFDKHDVVQLEYRKRIDD